MTKDDEMDVTDLAQRRYPTMGLRMAVHCFTNDRRFAALGALDERKRRKTGNIINFKFEDVLNGSIQYHLRRHTPKRREAGKSDEFGPLDYSSRCTMTIVEVPESTVYFVVPVDPNDLTHQIGRRKIATELRAARRRLERRFEK